MTKHDVMHGGSDRGMRVPIGDAAGTIPRDPLAEWGVDPMAHDAPTDDAVVTTRRRLLRLTILATEVGARFGREGIAHDPAAWMLTPRAAFHGARPIDACQDLLGFERAILLHGLGFGLDADPVTLDALLSDEDEASGSGRTVGPGETIH